MLHPSGSFAAAGLTTVLLATAATAQQWSRVSVGRNPGPRLNAAMVYAPSRQSVLLFGGWRTGGCNAKLPDTWEWRGGRWVSHSSWRSPVPHRWAHELVWDDQGKSVVLFGGACNGYFNDTWVWTATNLWQRVIANNQSGQPRPRSNYAAAYSPKNKGVLMFGGEATTCGPAVTFDDTWLFQTAGARWTLQQPRNKPSARRSHAIARLADRVILFGGAIDDKIDCTSYQRTVKGYFDDTWEWTGTDWKQLNPKTVPPKRAEHKMVWDQHRGRIVMYGGLNVGGKLDDTWEFDGTDWIRTATSGPGGPFEHALVYDVATCRTTLFGGAVQSGNRLTNWDYMPRARYGISGAGCSASGPVPTLAPVNTPRIGNTFQLDVRNSGSNANLILWFGARRLDIDVGGGCRVYASPDFPLLLKANGNGIASWRLLLPCLYQGVSFVNQAWVWDPGRMRFWFSNRGEARIGH